MTHNIHSPLASNVSSLFQLDLIQRDVEVPASGILSDILWSDPSEDVDTFLQSARGSGYLFGSKPVQQVRG